ncbi:class I SAM-dependent methyltransferase [Halosimplex aquaticum]
MTHWTESVYRENPGVFRRHLEDRLADATEESEDLLALLADHGVEPTTGLDVACGIGRHAVELADRGVSVRGLDISEAYLDRARERAADRGVAEAATFERGDMRDLRDRDGTYDVVYNLWTSFGYYDDETNRAVLRGMYERTADGGALVVELVNREGVLADFRPAGIPEDDDALVVESSEYDPETARMETTRRVFAEAGAVTTTRARWSTTCGCTRRLSWPRTAARPASPTCRCTPASTGRPSNASRRGWPSSPNPDGRTTH